MTLEYAIELLRVYPTRVAAERNGEGRDWDEAEAVEAAACSYVQTFDRGLRTERSVTVY